MPDIKRIRVSDAAWYVRNRLAFNAGTFETTYGTEPTFWARTYPYGVARENPWIIESDMCALRAEWRAAWDRDAEIIEYVVWSFRTPIAWVLGDGSVVQPDVKYSLTTSEHQRLTREGFDTRIPESSIDMRGRAAGNSGYGGYQRGR